MSNRTPTVQDRIDFEITDEMVEAAASAEYEHCEKGYKWEDAHPDDQRDYRESARVGLEAAAHLIAAAAVRKTSARFHTQTTSASPYVIGFLDHTATYYEARVAPPAGKSN